MAPGLGCEFSEPGRGVERRKAPPAERSRRSLPGDEHGGAANRDVIEKPRFEEGRCDLTAAFHEQVDAIPDTASEAAAVAQEHVAEAADLAADRIVSEAADEVV
ncbi:MAG: hypothetical protein AAFX50_03600, partial [Acidobacteriota bacterium]